LYDEGLVKDIPAALEDDGVSVRVQKIGLAYSLVTILTPAHARSCGGAGEQRPRLIVHERSDQHDLCAVWNTLAETRELYRGITVVDVIVKLVDHREVGGMSYWLFRVAIRAFSETSAPVNTFHDTGKRGEMIAEMASAYSRTSHWAWGSERCL
jgi:hypothetical protein